MDNSFDYSCAWKAKLEQLRSRGALRAAVYNRYLKTGGGGERSSLEFGRALEDLDFEITMISDPGVALDLKELAATFGIQPRAKWTLVGLAPEQINSFCGEHSIQVFVNHTFANYTASNVPLSIYALMFPHQISAQQVESLYSYRSIFCNSPFSELYARQRWDNNLPLKVAPPPIAEEHLRSLVLQEEKQKLILNVGRFNVDGHSKCQLEAIQAFLRLREHGVLDADWRMTVVGHINDGAENLEYYQQCARLAPELVSVRSNVSFEELIQLYRKSAVLFQFTGVDLDFGVIPEKCEHLGLVAMDALCYGTVPVVYERSGAALLTEWGDNAYAFSSYEELADCMRFVAADFGSAAHAAQMRRCRAKAQQFSYARFRAQLESVLLN